MYFFYNRTKIYENVSHYSNNISPITQVTLSSLFIPVNVTNLTNAISASRCDYHGEDGRWCNCKRIVTLERLWYN